MIDTPILLTPGPLTTSDRTRAALNRDWGSRNHDFITLNQTLLERLVAIVDEHSPITDAGSHGHTSEYVCVPIQGSGTFAVEAMLGTFVASKGKVLILVNGSYGKRMVKMCDYIQCPYQVYETPEQVPPDPAQVAAMLAADPAITHVAAVHCETTSGILNPLKEIGVVVAAAGRHLLVDAMSSFGAIPLSSQEIPIAAIAASANKGLEGVPGIAFVICQRSLLWAAKGQAHSLALDLHDQWQGLERNHQWRFTPPTQVLAALAAALDQLDEEGGVMARHRRYQTLCQILRDGMESLGFQPFLPPELQAPVIVTFKLPRATGFTFETFYQQMEQEGFILYPGKLTEQPSFRVGCIGAITEATMHQAIAAAGRVLSRMGSPLLQAIN